MITKIEQRKRTKWSKAVIRRDQCCVRCKTIINLEAHHIFPWSWFPKLRFLLRNGIALCKSCHSLVAHKTKITIAYNKWLFHKEGYLALRFLTNTELDKQGTELDLSNEWAEEDHRMLIQMLIAHKHEIKDYKLRILALNLQHAGIPTIKTLPTLIRL